MIEYFEKITIIYHEKCFRFHGAFTGGFSAGYFNTTGSRDGWAPKHFKSSRSNRFASSSQQRPEDFMDDEDMGDFGIAPQKLHTSDKFSKESEASKKRKHVPENLGDGGIIPGEPVLDQLIRPAKETVGVRLLKEMGWKPGQGVGPKLTRKHKKQISTSTKRLFGPSLPNQNDSSSDDEDMQYKDFKFAPDDIPNFVAKPKENLFGIGYKGLERGNVLGGGHINLFSSSDVLKFDNADKAKKGRKLKITGQAFGVGAYEEDDEDIYQRDDMSRYDFALEDPSANSSPEKGAKGQRKSRWDNNPAEDLITCLEGFALAKESTSMLQKRFDPPDLPPGFQPKGIKNKKSRFETSKDENLETTNPTPQQRHLAISTEEEKNETVIEEPTESEAQIRAFLSENFVENQNSANFKPFPKIQQSKNDMSSI